MLNVLSLFSGIGAFEKALDNLGVDYELVNFCEFDKYAVKSYCAIHDVDESKNLGDITKVDETKLPKDLDILTYGFPCQDISLAGKQKGLFNEDGTQTRSGLFFEALRIIEHCQPKIAIAENVKNLVSKKFNAQFQMVLASLDAAGYNSYWAVLNAKDFGVPQNRERVFIVSIRKDIDTGLFEFPEGFPLKKRLKDVLEDEVDEMYYLSDEQVKRLSGNVFTQANLRLQTKDYCDTLLARDYKDPKCVQVAQMYPNSGNPQAGRVYDADGISPTMDTCSGGNRMPKVLVREATKQGYAEAYEGDSINLEQLNITTSTVQKDNYVAEPKIEVVGNYSPSGRDTSRIVSSSGLAPTVKENYGTVTAMIHNLRIRKLTPKECFRLMGFDDESFHRAEAVNSNTQLYKQAGNSIVVNVLEAIYRSLGEKYEEFKPGI